MAKGHRKVPHWRGAMEDVSTLHTAVVFGEGKARTARANTTLVLLSAAAGFNRRSRVRPSLTARGSDRHSDCHQPQGHMQEQQDPKWGLEATSRQTPEGHRAFI